ncbi:hypothetical protein [Mesorhizobium sp. M7A.F.Ca.ET.027.02.1.1]|uniref:hypothetical protein n=1 Tax=Mesorhizobium sp. M7A.F.Ca.ET.027.02.1.1 TaxID=2496655 RepID=UPI001679E9F7|nr:hypothetical protein [Mesorhizobium sp. M7A.F.Ca.ET.027.02.1.1]
MRDLLYPASRRIGVPHLMPVVDDNDRQALVERVERRGPGDDDAAEIKQLPCPMAVQAVAFGGQHERVLRVQSPDRALRDAFRQEIDVRTSAEGIKQFPALPRAIADAEIREQPGRAAVHMILPGAYDFQLLHKPCRRGKGPRRVKIEPDRERLHPGVSAITILAVPGDQERVGEKLVDGVLRQIRRHRSISIGRQQRERCRNRRQHDPDERIEVAGLRIPGQGAQAQPDDAMRAAVMLAEKCLALRRCSWRVAIPARPGEIAEMPDALRPQHGRNAKKP